MPSIFSGSSDPSVLLDSLFSYFSSESKSYFKFTSFESDKFDDETDEIRAVLEANKQAKPNVSNQLYTLDSRYSVKPDKISGHWTASDDFVDDEWKNKNGDSQKNQKNNGEQQRVQNTLANQSEKQSSKSVGSRRKGSKIKHGRKHHNKTSLRNKNVNQLTDKQKKALRVQSRLASLNKQSQRTRDVLSETLSNKTSQQPNNSSGKQNHNDLNLQSKATNSKSSKAPADSTDANTQPESLAAQVNVTEIFHGNPLSTVSSSIQSMKHGAIQAKSAASTLSKMSGVGKTLSNTPHNIMSTSDSIGNGKNYAGNIVSHYSTKAKEGVLGFGGKIKSGGSSIVGGLMGRGGGRVVRDPVTGKYIHIDDSAHGAAGKNAHRKSWANTIGNKNSIDYDRKLVTSFAGQKYSTEPRNPEISPDTLDPTKEGDDLIAGMKDSHPGLDLPKQLENSLIFSTEADRYARRVLYQAQMTLELANKVQNDTRRALEQVAAAMSNPQSRSGEDCEIKLARTMSEARGGRAPKRKKESWFGSGTVMGEMLGADMKMMTGR